MRILMLSQFYSPVVGGEERLVEDLSVELAARGHSVAVATLEVGDTQPLETIAGVRVYRIESLLGRAPFVFRDPQRRHAPPLPDPLLIAGLERVVAKERPDVVHAHNWLVHSFVPLKRRTRAPLVLSLHDYGLICATKRLMYRGRVCSGPAALKCVACASGHYGALKGPAVAAGNYATSSWLRRVVDMYLPVSSAVAVSLGLDRQAVPYEVVPNFVPETRASPSDAPAEHLLSQLPSSHFLLYAGDATSDKGVDVLLRAHGLLRDAPPLVIIGRRLLPESPEHTAPVIWGGVWPHSALMEAMRRCTMLIVPSVLPETFGLVALEAMAAGIPVVASRTGGLVDVVADEETGLLVRPGDPEALCRAIQRLLEAPALREQMGRNAVARAATFGAAHVVDRIERIYESLRSVVPVGQ